jgi:hypothetical protein
LNYGNVVDLPDFSIGPHGTPEELHQAVADAHYEGLQGGDVELGRRSGLVLLGSGLLTQPSDAGTLAACLKEKGASVVTCIAGYGMESDQEMDAYAGAICEASADHEIPLLLETHRASITQDAWRTVQLTQRFPELRFNLDLSHWFTGQEMLYGDLDSRVNFLEPVLARTEFIHGRVGNRCCLQVPLEEAEKALPVFRRIWTRVMEAYLSREPDDDRSPQADLWFCPELLGPAYDYARLFREGGGEVREETDRWQQAAALVAIACECFQDALRFNVNGTRLTSENKKRTTRERVSRP